MWLIIITNINVYSVKCKIVNSVWIIMEYVIIVLKDILLSIPIIIVKNGLYKIVALCIKVNVNSVIKDICLIKKIKNVSNNEWFNYNLYWNILLLI